MSTQQQHRPSAVVAAPPTPPQAANEVVDVTTDYEEASELQAAQQLLWTMDKYRPTNTTKVLPAEPVEDDAPQMSGSVVMRRKSMRSLRRYDDMAEETGTPIDAPLVAEEGDCEQSVREENEENPEKRRVDANERSVRFRTEEFRPFNTWVDDRAALFNPELDAEEPIDLIPQEDQELVKSHRFFQLENNATSQHYDVLGFNSSQISRRVPQAIIVAHTDDDNIVYCTGNHITTVDMIDRGMRKMLPRHDQCIDIIAFAVSSSGKYVAVSERRTDGPCVAISRIDSGTRISVLASGAVAKTQVTVLAISSNNKYVATVTAAPEHKLVLWQLEDVRVMAVEDLGAKDIEVSAVTFCPWDSGIISTLGPRRLLQWTFADRSLVMTDLIASHAAASTAVKYSKLVDHCWYDENCLCTITSDGTMICIEQKVVVYCKPVSLPTPPQTKTSVTAVAPQAVDDEDGMRRTMSAKSFSAAASSISLLDSSTPRAAGKPQAKRSRAAMKAATHTFKHVVWASRGVVLTASEGTLALLDRTYDSRVFCPVCVFHVTNRKAEIISTSISPAEENLVVALSCNTMECVQLSTLDDAIANRDVWQTTLPISRESQALLQKKIGLGMIRSAVDEDERWGFVLKESVFTELPHASFHSDTITSMSIAMQAPVVLTTSADGTARLYDYVAHELVAFRRFGSDEILSSAIHPMGLHCIFTTEFSTQVFGVIGDSFVLMGDLDVRGAVDVKFSNNGGRLAFCVGNRVVIYDGHSYEMLGQLLGHTVMIKSISWSDNDRRLLTTDVAGTVCGWDTSTFRRDGLDLSQKNLIMQCAKFHSASGLLVGVGTNKHAQRKMFEGEFTILCAPISNPQAVIYLRPGMILPKALATRKLHVNLIAFAELSQTLFVGTPAGRIFLYSWPLIRSSRPYDYIDLDASEILHVALSNDERFLFSVTADNIMYIHRLDQQKDGRFVNVVSFNYDLFKALRYGLKSDQDAFARDAEAVRHLATERRRINAEDETKLREKLRMDNENFVGEKRALIERMRADLERARTTRVALEKRTVHEGLEVESQYSVAAESLEVQYNKLQEEANQRYLQLLRDKDDITVKYEGLISQRIMAGEREIKKMEEAKLAMEQRLSNEIMAVEAQIKERARKADAMLAQTVVDSETDVKELGINHEKQLKKNEENLQRAGAIASIGDREVERLQKECNAAKQILDLKRQKMKDITHALERKARETQELKVQMVAKQEAINVAEKKLQALKQQLAVLENIKFVLLHQLDAESAEIEPKDERIEELAEELSNIEVEMNAAESQRQLVAMDVKQAETELEQRISEHTKVRYDRWLAERKLQHLMATLTKACEAFRDPLQFSVLLKRTVNQVKQEASSTAIPERGGSPPRGPAAASSGPSRKSELEEPTPALLNEFEKITNQLQRKKVALTTFPLRRQQQLESNSADTVGENQQLVDEIKELRGEKKEVQSKIGVLETQLRETRNALQRLVENNRRQLLTERRTLLLTDAPRQTPSLTAATPIPMAPSPSPSLTQGPPTVARKALPPLSVTASPLDELDITWGSVKKAQPAASKKLAELPPRKGKKTASQSATGKLEARRSELQSVIGQLEDNTVRMRSQQQTISQLRGTVQRLLALEEQRLIGSLNAAHAAAESLDKQAHAVATQGSVDATEVGDTTIPMATDGPDWVAESGRPMTPMKGVS